MLILIVLLTIVAISIGLQRTLSKKQEETEQAFNQLAPLVNGLSEVAGKLIETLRNADGAQGNEFAHINRLRWQTTSRELSANDKTKALNELLAQFNQIWPATQNPVQNSANPQLEALYHHWNQLLHKLNANKEDYNNAAADFNDILNRFPYNGVAKLLRYHKKTLLHLPQS